MRVIIVDDEITSSQVLDKLLQQYLPQLNIVAICSKPGDALLKISKLHPDLVFMDIELLGMTGFDILEKIKNINFDVIFTTAHSQYAIKAIQYSAIDYLLKPINSDELIQAVQRVKSRSGFGDFVVDLLLRHDHRARLHQVLRRGGPGWRRCSLSESAPGARPAGWSSTRWC